jgi:hypothetical protein
VLCGPINRPSTPADIHLACTASASETREVDEPTSPTRVVGIVRLQDALEVVAYIVAYMDAVILGAQFWGPRAIFPRHGAPRRV